MKLTWGLVKEGEVDVDIRWDVRQVYRRLFKGRVSKRWMVMGRVVGFVKGVCVGGVLGVVIVLFYCWTIATYY